MARRRSSQNPPSQPQPVENASGRFDYVRRTKFAGSQSALASALGCSQSFLSRVVGGRKDPGPKLLTALAGLPGINPHWALTGEGEPFQAEQSATVPIAKVLLPGPPKDHADLLTGMTESVAPHHARDSTYMVVVTVPFAEHVLPGDRVLLDADPGLWQKNLLVLDGRLCAVQRRVSGGAVVELRRLCCHAEPSGKAVQLRAFRSRSPEPVTHPVVGKELRAIPLDELPAGSAGDSQARATARPFDVVAVDDVVAIAVELFRRL